METDLKFLQDLDAIDYLKGYDKSEEESREIWSISWLVDKIIQRLDFDKDCIIIIIGDRGTGKSNYELKLINTFIKKRRGIDPNFDWSWEKNFPLTRTQAMKYVEDLQQKSFICYDEGGDIVYSADAITKLTKQLVKFMLKSRNKNLLTIITLPDIFLLNKAILNMAHLLIAVPYRYKDICSWAFIYGRAPNPFVQDKFGLEVIKRAFASKKTPTAFRMPNLSGNFKVKRDNELVEVRYPRELFIFLKSLPNYLHSHTFTKAPTKFEAAYIKNVKSKQLKAQEEDHQVVDLRKYNDLMLKYGTLLYNLNTLAKVNYSRIERLHITPLGKRLTSGTTIKKIIENTEMKFEGKIRRRDAKSYNGKLAPQDL